MRLNKWVFIIIISLSVINFAALGIFWWRHYHPSKWDKQEPEFGNDGHRPPPPLHEFVSTELNLNEAQKKAYFLLRDEHRQFMQLMQDSLRKEKKLFFEAIADSAISIQQLNESYVSIANFQKSIDINTFYHFKKLRDICQKDQKVKLDSLISKILSMMKQGRNKPGPPF